ncbi:hypothetical protein UFOVP1196_86 [uncultured Caudovirales phage]|uniref:Uncharacterized protein n=1 Tax=uncultured Caudovirales phage TaxID=2100421 RepID=A0A6J5RAF3_9CAUD|nr:hypothetical protein UFOVP1196_86 [uncultured Caudovirales phage]
MRCYNVTRCFGVSGKRNNMNKKLWKSKTFWLNILSGAAAISGVIPLAPEHVAIATAVINIGLRLATDKPVSL